MVKFKTHPYVQHFLLAKFGTSQSDTLTVVILCEVPYVSLVYEKIWYLQQIADSSLRVYASKLGVVVLRNPVPKSLCESMLRAFSSSENKRLVNQISTLYCF